MFICSRNAQVTLIENPQMDRLNNDFKRNERHYLPDGVRCYWATSGLSELKFDHFIKYKLFQVTEACALVDDFKSLARGDMTNVGEKGSKLSGGQKARISLGKNKLYKIINKKMYLELAWEPSFALKAKLLLKSI